MTPVSFWDWLMIRLRLKPKPSGLTPVLHPQSALLLKGLTASAFILCIVGAYVASLLASGLLDPRGLWQSKGDKERASALASRLASGSGSGKDARDGRGLPAGHEEHRRFVESQFNAEAREAIQRVHDRLQLQYGDEAYRNVFKPAAAETALAGYLGEIGAGRIQTPRAYLQGLKPGDIDRISARASRDLGR